MPACTAWIDVGVGDDPVHWSRPAERVEVEADLDGVYIIRTILEA